MTDDDEIAELRRRLAVLEQSKARSQPQAQATPPKPPAKPGAWKRPVAIVAGLIAILFVFALIAPKSTTNTTSTSSENSISSDTSNAGAAIGNEAESTPNTTPAAAPASSWTYRDQTDDMGRVKHYACTTSINQISQGFPYHDTDGQLCVRQGGRGGLDIYVSLNSDGQILCGVEECSLPIKYDGENITRVPAVGAADNSSNVIFLRSESHVLAALRRAKKTVVEVRLYQNGDQDLDFNTNGLTWPPHE